jgi:hypothetical protein
VRCYNTKHNSQMMAFHSLRFVSDENDSGNVPVKGLFLRLKYSSRSGREISKMQVVLETKRAQIAVTTYQGSTTFRIRMARSPGSCSNLDLGVLCRDRGVSRARKQSIKNMVQITKCTYQDSTERTGQQEMCHLYYFRT